jgi:signal transduction histidine kinase
MRGQIERLTKLTTDLLDLSKLDSDALRVRAEPVELGRIAREISGEFGPAAEGSGHAIEVREPRGRKPLADADPARTAQILRILLDNALKHTPGGTRILIETQMNEDGCRVAVTDDGPGIEPAARERVFERFYTADSVSGSGLGLAIARELARLMGGEIDLRTHRGRTTFALTLPAVPVHA